MRTDGMDSLSDVFDDLKSNGVKVRQEALSKVRQAFARNSTVNNFHLDSDGNPKPLAWLPVFQALFTAVGSEKEAFTKKKAASTARKRLSEAASTVRWLTERSAHVIGSKTSDALFNHLRRTMVHQGEILDAVSLDYIKALRCLVGFTPHLEHMKEMTWVALVEMGFNIVLGDPIHKKFEDDDAEGTPAPETDDSDLFDDESMDMDSDDLPSTSKKRARSDSASTIRPSSSKRSFQYNHSRKLVSVSHEQVEFMSVLSILLRSHTSLIISASYPNLAQSILSRLQRFLDMYAAETTLIYDYIALLSSVLPSLSLNRVFQVQKFARASWDNLLGLWGTKNKRIKEGLVVILRTLYPFLTFETDAVREDPSFDCAHAISRLSSLLKGEAESKWGVDGLSLDSLRLELNISHTSQIPQELPFVARTLRSGPNFDETQALAWAILELQADCVGKLFQLSESIHPPPTPRSTSKGGKRARLEDPVMSILVSIRAALGFRSYYLQILFFVIDRHWSLFHDSLQHEVLQALLQYISLDDSIIQSWVYLCLAAIAHAEGLRNQLPSADEGNRAENSATWESIWTNAVRRANAPVVSRAACHTAYVILFHAYGQKLGNSRIPLSSQKILLEIETLAKDLDVQGPPHPYDAVCAFLTRCLRVASQDMRLYRMQLEEKALTWLMDTWKIGELRKRALSLHMISDILLLLESICGFPKRCDLVFRILLPECQISDAVVNDVGTKVIRDFLLSARLPQSPPSTNGASSTEGSAVEIVTSGTAGDVQLAQPRGRERRITGFLSKSLENLLSVWEDGNGNGNLSAEAARHSLDLAVTALTFETTLVINGTQANRRLIQHACKLIGVISTLLPDTQWTPIEKAVIVLGFEPLICLELGSSGDVPWDVMLPPDAGSGIKSEHLNCSTGHRQNDSNNVVQSRTTFLRILWQNADVQSAFVGISNTLRTVLQNTLVGKSSSLASDERDGFAPIKAVTVHQPLGAQKDIPSHRLLAEISMAFLTVGPTLQSASGEPTRDKDLIDLVLGCVDNPDTFMLVLSILLEKIRRRIFNISINNLDDTVEGLTGLLQVDPYKKSERLRSLVVQFLESTMDIWMSQEGPSAEDTVCRVQEVVCFLTKALQNGKIKTWQGRDALARFLFRYLDKDPTEATWDAREAQYPSTLLPLLGADEDIRVRFRVASLNARLFSVARRAERDPLEVYGDIKKSYTRDVDYYEHMLTRMLSLGNVMIMSSAVRRGPYWHLLETCIHSPRYSAHIESILNGVSNRLGTEKLSALFESYASQLAFSIRQAQSDILCFPPHLLGYQNRMECAEATFRAFAPINIWNGGQKSFESHCKVLSKSTQEGIREYFGDIVGYKIVTWIDQNGMDVDGLAPLLLTTTSYGDNYRECLGQNVDGVIVFILRTLGDQDFSDDGPIVKALGEVDQTGHIVRSFQGLTRYRSADTFETHPPNLPEFPTETILRAFDWLRSQVPDVDARATTYHVLHQLFADTEQSSLVNEQHRLLNAMCLWIALHHQDFRDLTLLHTLMRGATALLAQVDLARTAQSILDWALSTYRQVKLEYPHVSNILVRICCLAHDHASSNLSETTALMGRELLQWIDAQMLKLSKISTLLPNVHRALSAWPHQPSQQLALQCESITSKSLSSVLNDPRIISSKFRIVRRLRDRALGDDYDGTNFATSDFWRLKEAIPSSGHLQDADVDAFAHLLYLGRARLDSFRSEAPNSSSILNRHRKVLKDSGSDSDMARGLIVLSLLTELQGDSASRSYAAYQTLRLIKAISIGVTANFNGSSTNHEVELQYLETCSRPPRPQYNRDLSELLTTEMYIDSTRHFGRWVGITTTLLSEVLSKADAFYAQLTPILASDTEFASEMLPVLVHTLLRVEKLSNRGSDATHRTTLSTYFTNILSAGFASANCLRSIIDVVLHLRSFSDMKPDSRPNDMTGQDALGYNKWLALDFMLLAQGAITCGAYTTALLFLELALDNPPLMCSNHASSEQILYEIYRHIDEPDGFYGIQDEDLHQNLMRRFHHEQQWERAFYFHGAALEAGHTHSGHAEGLIQSFHSFGFDHLANDALRGASFQGENKELSATSYRLAWRTETWDLPDRQDESTAASVYLALRAIHRERDGRVIDRVIRTGLNTSMERLRTLGSESFTEIREVVRDLMCLYEMEKWRRRPFESDLGPERVSTDSWASFVGMSSDFDFSDLESIMATRISLVRSARQKEERQQIGTLITPSTRSLIEIERKSLVQLSSAARAAGRVQIALNSIIRAQRLENAPTFKVFEEFSSVLWSQGEERAAIEYLDRLRSDDGRGLVQDMVGDTEKALLLARLGSWSSQACLKKPTDIQGDYFNPAINILLQANTSYGVDTQVSHASVYHECAIFAERQYNTVAKSPDAIRWKLYMDRKNQEIQARQADIDSTPHTQAELTNLANKQTKAKKLLEEDNQAYWAHIAAQDTFLKQAIDMFSRCLEISDTFDGDAGIRLCSLWFANFENEENGLQKVVQTALDRVPSRKLVFLAHQLSARMSKPESDPPSISQDTLQKVVLRMCHEHPFHSLYQVYCLQPDRPSTLSRRQSFRHSIPPTPSTQTERSAAAGDIFDRLRDDRTSGERVRNVEYLCDASMQWAKYELKKKKDNYRGGGPFKLPAGLAIGRISNLQVPVITHRTPLDPTLRYDNCVWIAHYESTFTLAGGNNLPKITVCAGNDGSKHKQLFKGEGGDDLRQDAVMEQVFDLVNSVLRQDRETRRRLLSVRDYKVIPLDSQSGILEFVGNTYPLQKWLVPAHARYYPKDLTSPKVSEAIARIQAEHKYDLDKLIQAFEALKKKFHPVMRHYFTEKHKTPIAWFGMRLNYIRSVATTSIVGHILGLGDRHISNILIDTVSGQVVHIDLGIAFEQGKLLPIPELVPFRMTRDIVDGMGMSGTAGVFQRCAEETLRVLRDGSDIIMTVLEVFKHDPLHSWTASDVKIQRVQEVPSGITATSRFGTGIGIDMSSGTAEEAADRALNTVARKLDKALSVEYTVNQLISDATDSRNLARIYKGWSALC